ncbi:phosphatidylglycerol/phosphatidylinositol transfer protein precursor [Eremomyces bilateralis CBS 781.70]|uniref:Phosphatidylglycerol/phosphatidylinositol transfer protein n=1 Tax=Eremomyces bilateralis CBS 781.70 TaxID=1392243 RepID=A0A6G1G527_9PEZI|nr:phosphatidylglycerol/phosphatidylinositol transfer protein precursor [Eremomyces bilateralis CBS 781.70]KAF1813154.1 phosphatidylglycerol/phosphatidylinositol transfer protein precursor [Eremomyces bilateralis CBS 781.70]
MRFTTPLVSLVLASAVAANQPFLGLGLGGSSSQVHLNEDIEVPGDNPLCFCDDPSRDILKIDQVDLFPNPPQPGATLTIAASGTLKQDVEDGAKVHLRVKYGLITLINQDANLCEQIKNVDLQCPLKAGALTFTKDVNLPREIPPGHYTVLADVLSKDGKKITCLTAKVNFTRG